MKSWNRYKFLALIFILSGPQIPKGASVSPHQEVITSNSILTKEEKIKLARLIAMRTLAQKSIKLPSLKQTQPIISPVQPTQVSFWARIKQFFSRFWFSR